MAEYTVRVVVDVPDAVSFEQAAREARDDIRQRIADGEWMAFEVADVNGNVKSFDM